MIIGESVDAMGLGWNPWQSSGAWVASTDVV